MVGNGAFYSGIDMKEFYDPYAMAAFLARRRIGIASIIKAVEARFGYAPSKYEIARMRGEYAMRRQEIREAAVQSDDKYEYMSEAERREAMKDFCDTLLRALWANHGRIMKHYKDNGLNVVMP